MDERHDREQYFFSDDSRDRLVKLAAGYAHVACVCAPTLGCALQDTSTEATILDLDERFADVPGFRSFDLTDPSWIGITFDLVVCDPPFFAVPLGQLFDTLGLIVQHRPSTPLLVSYLTRRRDAVLRAGARFGLQATGIPVGYATVADIEKNRIEWFSNLPDDALALLRGP